MMTIIPAELDQRTRERLAQLLVEACTITGGVLREACTIAGGVSSVKYRVRMLYT